jgi:hypothetical protein
MRKTFGDALHNVKTPSISGLNLITIGTDQEERFFDSLGKLKVMGKAVDETAKYKREVTEQSTALQAIWDEETKRGGEIESDEENLLKQLDDALKSAVERAASAHQSLMEKSVKFTSFAGKVAEKVGPLLPEDLAAAQLLEVATELVGVFGNLSESVEAMDAKIEDRRDRYTAYFENDHKSLLVVYSDTRKRAKEFVDRHGYDGLTVITGQARGALSNFRAEMKTSGQQSDADAFLADSLKVVDELERNAKEVWDNFVKANDGHFFGRFGPDVEAALIGSGRFDAEYSRIASLDLHGLMTRWLDDSRDVFEVDPSNFDDKTKELLEGKLRSSLEKFRKSAKNLAAEAEPGNFDSWIRGKARTLWSLLTS